MIVMKFGSTSLKNADCIRRAVHIVAQHRDQHPVEVSPRKNRVIYQS